MITRQGMILTCHKDEVQALVRSCMRHLVLEGVVSALFFELEIVRHWEVVAGYSSKMVYCSQLRSYGHH